MSVIRPAGCVLATALLLVACGGGPAQRSPAPPQTAPTTAPPVPAPLPSAAPTGTRGTVPGVPMTDKEIEVKRRTENPSLITGVRYAGHPGFDRVVVDLKGAVPGYSVRWVDGFVQDGSGKAIAVNGGAYLQITLTPANAHTEAGDPTWGEERVYSAGLTNVRHVVATGDFEAVVGIGLALSRRAGFRAFVQSAPDRLVVDVAH
ncbi:AMIN-like domain-containing (lipo)protein [Sinosporangium siamense]|nr:hypothetical protein [Sinosporangium siamense]